MKQLIINADDFGFTTDVNDGIVQAHREGVLTATTLMANGDAFEHAVALAKANPALDIGVHLVLIQGRALTTGKPFPETPRDVVLKLLRGGLDVYGELRAQIERVIAAGLQPSHLDTHKHTHIVPSVFGKVARLAKEFGIPYIRVPIPFYRRAAGKHGVRMTDHFEGYKLTGRLTEETFLAALAKLKPGLTEFMCHPGLLEAPLQRAATRLKESRVRELEALLSPRVRRFMDEAAIRLATYRSAVAGR